MNEGKRLLSVFIAPSALFGDIKERSRWWLPLLILLVVAATASVLPRLTISPEVFLEGMRQNLPQGVEMSEEQLNVLAEQASSPLAIMGTALTVMIVQTIITFLAALAFWAIFAIFGGQANFGKSVSVVSYTGLVTALGMIFVSILSVILQRVDIITSLALLPFLEPGSFLYRFAAQIDLFAVWRIILMGLGFSIVVNVSKIKGFLLVIIPWLLVSLALASINIGFGR